LAGIRRSIPAATEAALWALSNGRCYAPGCPVPVVVEIRAGVYRKNAQIGHIYGVSPGAQRFKESLPDHERDAFTNLLLLCLPHHAEVDDKRTGERLYPPDLLREWKVKHEGANGQALAQLGQIDEERLVDLLLDVFTPPIERLQSIADQLDATGTLNAHTVFELRQVISVLRDSPGGMDRTTAMMLAEAADIYSSYDFHQAAIALAQAADTLPTIDRNLARSAEQLSEAADLVSSSMQHMRRLGGEC
jgi:hypothetical protein